MIADMARQHRKTPKRKIHRRKSPPAPDGGFKGGRNYAEYIPTPQEISDACEAIRDGLVEGLPRWTDNDFRIRGGGVRNVWTPPEYGTSGNRSGSSVDGRD